MQTFLPALLIIGILAYFWYRTVHRNAFVREKRDTFLKRHGDEIGFLCDGQEEIDKHKVQLYGGVLGKSIKPGDSLIDTKGKQYQIKEVYADKKNPSKQSTEMTEGEFSNAIVIEATDWEYKDTEAQFKKDGIILFRIASGGVA